MRKLYLLKTILLLCALVVGSGNVWADDYELYSGTITEGDYIIYYNGYTLKSQISSNRFANGTATPSNNVITTADGSVVWHIAKDGDYWTLYNESVSKYAAGSTSKNYGALLSSVTDYAKWTVTGSSTYEFENKGRAGGSSSTGNKWLRNNGSNGWAPYASSTGGALSLYKKVDATAPSVSALDINVAYNATSGTITYSITNPVDGASVTASTSNEWISNFSYATGTVTFDVSKNATLVDRAGTVTLTYANGGTTLATKIVNVTQAHLDVAAPTFSVDAGTYNTAQSVTISGPESSTIYYTTDESTPTTSSSSYSGAISVNVSTTLKAIAVIDGVSSTVAEAAYELQVVTPTISPNGGTFNESQDVTLACETASATIYYTLDDTTPTNESTLYSTAFTLTDSKTVKVIAFKDGWTASEVASATFTKTDPNNVWVKTGLSALESGDIFVIVEDHGSYKYAMSNDKGTSNAPTAVKVTISNNLITSDVADNIKWNISGNIKDGYTFYPNGTTEKWLYCTNTNNGVRVGTNSNKTFTIDHDYLKHVDSKRYVGVYETNPDWRCYDSYDATNIKDESFSFYKKGITVTLSSACTDGTKYYGTFCSSVPFKVPADVTVSEIGIDNGGKLIVQNYATGAVVPANTGVMISSTTAGKKILTLASGGSSLLGDNNCLRSSGFAISDQTTTGTNCLFYRLTMHNGTDLGFYWGAASGAAFAIGANKAYLAVPTSLAREGFWFEDDAASVEEKVSVNGEESDSAVYDLQGRRVDQPTKGLYIVNGKKVIVK